MAPKFNPAPGWPTAPEGWLPAEGWAPDASWPPAPAGWQTIIDDGATFGTSGTPGDLWSAKGQPLTGIGGGRFRLTATTLFFERGTLTTNAQQVPTRDLFDIDLRQTLTQKARGIGDVVVQVHRGSSVEQVILNDVPKPRDAVNIINQVANQARIDAHAMANTRHFTSAAPAAPAPPVAAPVAATGPDAIEQLTKLGQLRDAGILTEDEFAQKKADILARM